jgi:hypothetical protein
MERGPAPSAREAEQLDAERHLMRDAIIGVCVGMVVGAAIWAFLVFLALVGTDWEPGPMIVMGALVGVFAGAFYGGWAGVVAGSNRLEHAESQPDDGEG